MVTRRDFIKTMSLLSGVVLAPVRWLGRWASPNLLGQLPLGGVQPAQTEEPPEGGELYAGFVLLPEGAPMPSFVQCASGAPILCRVEDARDSDVTAFRGETLWFDNIESLRDYLSFPIYIPTSLPRNIELMYGYVIRFVQSQEVFAAKVDFGIEGNPQPLISLSAQAIFPHPYPVWPVGILSENSESQDEVFIPEKVDFTPTSGVMFPTLYGHVLHWVSENVLYTLIVEHDRQHEAAVKIAKTLIKI